MPSFRGRERSERSPKSITRGLRLQHGISDAFRVMDSGLAGKPAKPLASAPE
jgi:hypothetical protein